MIVVAIRCDLCGRQYGEREFTEEIIDDLVEGLKLRENNRDLCIDCSLRITSDVKKPSWEDIVLDSGQKSVAEDIAQLRDKIVFLEDIIKLVDEIDVDCKIFNKIIEMYAKKGFNTTHDSFMKDLIKSWHNGGEYAVNEHIERIIGSGEHDNSCNGL